MNDYILELEHLNHEILEYDMKLPDIVLDDHFVYLVDDSTGDYVLA